MSLITPVEKFHLINLPSLTNFSGKARKDCLHSDGIHTTEKGFANLTSDIIVGVKTVFTDLVVKNTSDRKDKPRGGGSFSRGEHRDLGGASGGSQGGANGTNHWQNQGRRGKPWHGQQSGHGQFRGGRGHFQRQNR